VQWLRALSEWVAWRRDLRDRCGYGQGGGHGGRGGSGCLGSQDGGGDGSLGGGGMGGHGKWWQGHPMGLPHDGRPRSRQSAIIDNSKAIFRSMDSSLLVGENIVVE